MTDRPHLPPFARLRRQYDDRTLALVYDWLGVARPPALRNLALSLAPDDLGFDLGFDLPLSNTVARCVLASIQAELPQWALVHADNTITLGRNDWPEGTSGAEFAPVFLFEVNWADSAPGFSWPEAYHATHLPGFDVVVVTAAVDSSDNYGYTELAIGWFPAHKPLEEGARAVILDWWRRVRLPMARWVYLFDTGVIEDATACAWAVELWDAETGEPLGQTEADTW